MDGVWSGCANGWEKVWHTRLSSIIVVAEGDEEGDALQIAEKLKNKTTLGFHVAKLGYIQRGGAPTARDRVLATQLGAFAVDKIIEGSTMVMAGEIKGDLVTTALEETVSKKKGIDTYLSDLIKTLSI